MEKDNIKGCFVSSVLLSQNQWDKKQFIHDFEEDWGIVLTDDDDNGEDRKSTRLNSSHWNKSRMPSSA